MQTICDPTAMFLGRDVGFMRRVAEETGLQVVPCTGIYTYDYLPPFFATRDPDQIADLFVRRHRGRASRAPRSRPRSSSAPPTSRA